MFVWPAISYAEYHRFSVWTRRLPPRLYSSPNIALSSRIKSTDGPFFPSAVAVAGYFLFVFHFYQMCGASRERKSKTNSSEIIKFAFSPDCSRAKSKTKHMSRQLVQCFLTVSNLSQPGECFVPSFRRWPQNLFFWFTVNFDSRSLLMNFVKYLRFANR